MDHHNSGNDRPRTGPSRRGFLAGAFAAFAGSRLHAMPGSGLASSPAAGGPIEHQADSEAILIHIGLRGGVDSLALVPPTSAKGQATVAAARPSLATLDALDLDGRFGFHPAAQPLADLYAEGRLAIVRGAGYRPGTTPELATRHFEQGDGEDPNTVSASGWLERHLQSAPNLPQEIYVPSMALGNQQPASLLGTTQTLHANDVADLDLDAGPRHWRARQQAALAHLYDGDSWLDNSAKSTLAAIDVADFINRYGAPAPAHVRYPATPFGDQLQQLAQTIRLDLGLRVASLELGGWDTRRDQAAPFADRVDELSRGIEAFYRDLRDAGLHRRVLILAHSESGRTIAENQHRGTSPAGSSVMLLVGYPVHAGIYGSTDLVAADDGGLRTTIDSRSVLGEAVSQHLGNPHLDRVFPGFEADPAVGFLG